MSLRGSEKGPVSIEAVSRAVETDAAESWPALEAAPSRPQRASSREEMARRKSHPDRILGSLAGLLTIAAILASAVLLLADATPTLAALYKVVLALAPRVWSWMGHAPLSALPLLLAGASFIALQAVLRPPPMELLRRLLLGSAFVLWGIDQLMPPSVLATDLGDLVIALYVFDLGLMVQAELQNG
jgi:hypothetical protein